MKSIYCKTIFAYGRKWERISKDLPVLQKEVLKKSKFFHWRDATGNIHYVIYHGKMILIQDDKYSLREVMSNNFVTYDGLCYPIYYMYSTKNTVVLFREIL